MPIVTDAWSEVDPLGTDGFNTVDDAMQRLERRIRERANQGSHDWNNATLARAGRHSLGHGGGSVGDGVDGEFSIYDEDVTTKLFRLCNNNAAVAAADRQAIHYNWAVLKKILLDNFVDGANVAFALDTGVAVANAAAKVLQILVNGVEKLALDKDLLFLTANVPTAGLVANAVTVLSSGTGTTDFSPTGAYSVITGATVTLTPASASSIILLIAVIPHESNSASIERTNCRIVNGATVIHESASQTATASTGEKADITLMGTQTGLAGAQTWNVESKAEFGAPIIKSSSTDRKARLVVIELKR